MRTSACSCKLSFLRLQPRSGGGSGAAESLRSSGACAARRGSGGWARKGWARAEGCPSGWGAGGGGGAKKSSGPSGGTSGTWVPGGGSGRPWPGGGTAGRGLLCQWKGPASAIRTRGPGPRAGCRVRAWTCGYGRGALAGVMGARFKSQRCHWATLGMTVNCRRFSFVFCKTRILVIPDSCSSAL